MGLQGMLSVGVSLRVKQPMSLTNELLRFCSNMIGRHNSKKSLNLYSNSAINYLYNQE